MGFMGINGLAADVERLQLLSDIRTLVDSHNLPREYIWKGHAVATGARRRTATFPEGDPDPSPVTFTMAVCWNATRWMNKGLQRQQCRPPCHP